MLVSRQRKETVFDALRMGECEQEKIEKKEREREKTCLLLHRVKVGILSGHAHDQNSTSQILIMQLVQ
jgi:hypothetical protein